MPVLEAELRAKGKREVDQLRDSLGRFTTQTGAAGAATGRAEKQFQKFQRTAQSTARTLSTLVGGLTAVAAVRAGTRTIAGFEESLATLRAVSIDTTKTLAIQERQFSALNDAARDLGATTRFTAQQASEGLLALGRAGFSVEEQLAAIPATLNLASAGLIDLGRASEIASGNVRAFNLSASDTARVADALVAASNRSNATVEGLAESFKSAAPIAGSFGISVEELAASVGVLRNRNIDAGTAGINLRQILLQIVNPTSSARAALREMGVALEDLDPSVQTLASLMATLGEANLTAGRAAQIFGTRNAASAVILAESASQVANLTERIVQNRGESERVARAIEDTLSGSFRSLNSAIQEIVLSAGDAGLGGTLRGIVDEATRVARVLGDVEGQTEGLSERTFALASGLRLAGQALAAFVAVRATRGILNLSSGLAGLITKLGALGPLGVGAVAGFTIGTLILRVRDLDRAVREGTEGFRDFNNALAAANDQSDNFDRELSRISGLERLGEALDSDAKRAEALSQRLQTVQDVIVQGEQNPSFRLSRDQFEGLTRTRGSGDLLLQPDALSRGGAANERLIREAKELEAALRELDGSAQSAAASVAEAVGGPEQAAPTGRPGGGSNRDLVDALRAQAEEEKRLLDIQRERASRGGAQERLDALELERSVQEQLAEIQRAAAQEEITLSQTQLELARDILTSLEQKKLAQDEFVESLREEVRVAESLGGVSAGTAARAAASSAISGRSAAPVSGVSAADAAAAGNAQARGGIDAGTIALRELNNAGNQLATDLATATRSIADDSKTTKDILIDLGASLAASAVEAVVRSIAGAVTSGAASAARVGLVAGEGQVLRAQSGAVINRPTRMQLGGTSVIAGEAEPEAVMPLRRLPNGRLGVEATGGGRQPTNVTVVQNIQGVQDSREFRRNSRNIAADAGAGIRQALASA